MERTLGKARNASIGDLLKRVRGGIFDLDGTLFNSETVYRSAWQQSLAEQGLKMSNTFYNQNCVGRSNEHCESVLSRRFGTRVDLGAFRASWPIHWDHHVQRYGMPLKKGANELLSWFSEHQIPVALATSSHYRDVEKTLATTHLVQFGAIVTGDDIPSGRGKPLPDTFWLAAEKINVPITYCAVFEDSEPGIRAARSCGALAVMIPDLKKPSPGIRSVAHLVAPSLLWVRDRLKDAERRSSEGQRTA
jgi:HAD superfamily hydrolase (TIGR01509 family)